MGPVLWLVGSTEDESGQGYGWQLVPAWAHPHPTAPAALPSPGPRGTSHEEGGSRLGNGSRSKETQLEPPGEEREMLKGDPCARSCQGAAQFYVS